MLVSAYSSRRRIEIAGKRAATVLRRVQTWRSGYHCRSRLAGEHGGPATIMRMTQHVQNALGQATPFNQNANDSTRSECVGSGDTVVAYTSHSGASALLQFCGGCKPGLRRVQTRFAAGATLAVRAATTVGAGLLAKAVCRRQGYRLTRCNRLDTLSQSLSSRLAQRICPTALSGRADERLHQFSFCRQGFRIGLIRRLRLDQLHQFVRQGDVGAFQGVPDDAAHRADARRLVIGGAAGPGLHPAGVTHRLQPLIVGKTGEHDLADVALQPIAETDTEHATAVDGQLGGLPGRMPVNHRACTGGGGAVLTGFAHVDDDSVIALLYVVMSAGLNAGTGRGISGSAGSSSAAPPSSNGRLTGPGLGEGPGTQLPLTWTAGRHTRSDNSVSDSTFTAAELPVSDSLPAAETCRPTSSGAVLAGSSGLSPSISRYEVQRLFHLARGPGRARRRIDFPIGAHAADDLAVFGHTVALQPAAMGIDDVILGILDKRASPAIADGAAIAHDKEAVALNAHVEGAAVAGDHAARGEVLRDIGHFNALPRCGPASAQHGRRIHRREFGARRLEPGRADVGDVVAGDLHALVRREVSSCGVGRLLKFSPCQPRDKRRKKPIKKPLRRGVRLTLIKRALLAHLDRGLQDGALRRDGFGVRLVVALRLDQLDQLTGQVNVGFFQRRTGNVSQRTRFRRAGDRNTRRVGLTPHGAARRRQALDVGERRQRNLADHPGFAVGVGGEQVTGGIDVHGADLAGVVTVLSLGDRPACCVGLRRRQHVQFHVDRGRAVGYPRDRPACCVGLGRREHVQFHVDRGRAVGYPRGGRTDGLALSRFPVLDVERAVAVYRNAGGGGRRWVGDDVARLVKLQLSLVSRNGRLGSRIGHVAPVDQRVHGPGVGVRLAEVLRQGVFVALAVVDRRAVSRRVGRGVSRIEGRTGVDRLRRIQVRLDRNIRGGLRRHVRGVDLEVGQDARLHVAAGIGGVTLQVIAVGVDNVARRIGVEVTGAGVQLLAVVAHHEEAVAVDRQVQITAGAGGQRTLGELLGHSSGVNAAADVGAARCATNGLRVLVGEFRTGTLETDGRDVGNVVAGDSALDSDLLNFGQGDVAAVGQVERHCCTRGAHGHTADRCRQVRLEASVGALDGAGCDETVIARFERLARFVLAVPLEGGVACFGIAQVDGADNIGACAVVNLDGGERARPRHDHGAAHAFGGVDVGRTRFGDHRAPDQRRRLQRLGRLVHSADRIDRGAQVLHGFQTAELRQLGHELTVVLWVQRVLVLHLRHQQLQERVLAQAVGAGGAVAGLAGGRRLQRLEVVGGRVVTDGSHVSRPLSLTEGQDLLHHGFRGVHDFRVGLERTAGRDHVSHLVDHVDVRVVDVAVLVRRRVVWLVTRFQVGGVFDDACHLYARAGLTLVFKQRAAAAGLLTLENGSEHRMAGAVGLVHAGGHGFGVGDVTGHGVEASVLGTHAATGNIENTGQGHGLLSAQGCNQPFEFAVEQGEAGLKTDGVFGVIGVLDLGVDGVLVQRRLRRGAVEQAGFAIAHAFGFDVTGVGHVEGEVAIGGLVALRRQDFGEVEVPRLVVGRVGVGNVVGQHFGTLGTEVECLFMDAKCVVETDAHVGTFEG
nr:hypothetical protein [Tanacetum cinerariifolium]